MKYEEFEWKDGESSPALHACDVASSDAKLFNKVSVYLSKLYGDKPVGAVVTAVVTMAICEIGKAGLNKCTTV